MDNPVGFARTVGSPANWAHPHVELDRTLARRHVGGSPARWIRPRVELAAVVARRSNVRDVIDARWSSGQIRR